jgi:hypothetical protein
MFGRGLANWVLAWRGSKRSRRGVLVLVLVEHEWR